jgi:methionyl-tRNA formyltransferase
MPGHQPLRWVLLGHGPLGLALLQGLIAHPQAQGLGAMYWMAPTLSAQEKPTEDYQQWCPLADAAHVPPLPFTRANGFGFSQWLALHRPDVVFLGTWGEILKPHVCQLPQTQFINCHPSLLPRHRGPNPYAAAILAGDSTTGVSFHQLTSAIDAGPLLMQQSVPILPTDTGGTLRLSCAKAAQNLIGDVVDAWHQGTLLPGHPQSESEATYEKAPTGAQGRLDWQRSPEEVDCWFRALSPWVPHFFTLVGLVGVQFRELTVTDRPSAFVPCLKPGTCMACESEQGEAVLWMSSTHPDKVYQLRGLSWVWPSRWPPLPRRIPPGLIGQVVKMLL